MKTAWIVAGLGYGDEGKGSIVDSLCREKGATLVVRYNGGPQAAHNVVLPGGKHHEFHQFGSGMFLPNVFTHLSRFMLIEPFALLNEANALESKGAENILERTSIDDGCVVITPWHWMMNQLREKIRGADAHGSCGRGVGEARQDSLRGLRVTMGDIRNLSATGLLALIKGIKRVKLTQSAVLIGDTEHETVQRMLDEPGEDLLDFYRDFSKTVKPPSPWVEPNIVMEGAQGVLLDEVHGFQPHTTWTNTTFENALQLCGEHPNRGIYPFKIGVIRSYLTRHGAGPFPTEGQDVQFPDHNSTGEWQGRFRQGKFDMVALKYAIKACGGVHMLAVTHMDRVGEEVTYCHRYAAGMLPAPDAKEYGKCVPEYETCSRDTWIQRMPAPVKIFSFGPEHRKKEYR